jgi:plastocyanin
MRKTNKKLKSIQRNVEISPRDLFKIISHNFWSYWKSNYVNFSCICIILSISLIISLASGQVFAQTKSNNSSLIVGKGVSPDGSVHVTIISTPIELHQPLAIQVSFTDARGNKIQNENYGISAEQQVSNGVLILSNYTAFAANGNDIQITSPLENISPVNFDIQLQGSGSPNAGPASLKGPIGDVYITLGRQFGQSAAISQNSASAQQVVTIPFGAFNPRFDTKAPQWYMPSVITVGVNQTVTWINQDKEVHTVTSGQSSGRVGLVRNGMGHPNGLFDSGLIKPGQSWTHEFTKVGTFEYFCMIHPWMEGYVQVVKNESIPVDANGNKIVTFPVVRFTPDKKIEADLDWEPHYITTGQKIIFIFQFYDNVNFGTIPAHYVFTITQNGKQLYKTDDATQSGGGYKYFQFSEPGPVIFRFDIIDRTDQSVQYSTIVEQGNSTNTSGMNMPIVEPARNLELSWWLMPLFFTPCFMAIGGIYILKKRKKSSQKMVHDETFKKTPV